MVFFLESLYFSGPAFTSSSLGEINFMFEIRTYHIDPNVFDAFKNWAQNNTVPYVKNKMNVIGYWANNQMEPIHQGALPHDENASQANITWVIHWQDRAERDRVWDEVKADPEWKAIFAKLPGGRGSFLRMETRFATEF